MHLLIPARGVLAALLALSFIGAASAHSLWLERQGDGLRLYFGEFEENLREASPGLLDRLSPQAKVAVAGDKALKVDKTAGFFPVAWVVSVDDSGVAEDVRIAERRTAEKVTRVLARLGARYVADFKERLPLNTLDVVPAGKPGAFKVSYQGKPLAKAKLELIAESGWKREFKTDEQGAVEVPLPWRGTYVIEVQQPHETGGEVSEEAYDTLRCASGLSFHLPGGPLLQRMSLAATLRSA